MKILSVIVSEVSFFVGNFLYAVEPRCLQLLDDNLYFWLFCSNYEYFVQNYDHECFVPNYECFVWYYASIVLNHEYNVQNVQKKL